MELDKDLQSVQQVRNLIKASKEAQKILARYTHDEIDRILTAITGACEKHSERLAKLAAEETGFGIWQDKVLKNKLGSRVTYNFIKDMRTTGIVHQDPVQRIWQVAVPVGVVAGIIPSTNPTSTVMYKALISIKSGNSVVFSPHPAAKGCILETVGIIRAAIQAAGGPEDAVTAISIPTLEATNALMRHPDIGVILATGGPGMVKAAYSSGNPALGVGAGNAPAFIHRSADIPAAVKRIFASKCFDNGTICASEQSIVTESCVREQVIAEAKKQGGYFLNEKESAVVAGLLLRPNGSMNPAIVGKSALTIADMAGIRVPEDTRVLISAHTQIGEKHPYSREKLCPVLGFFVEEDWEAACERSIQLLCNEGVGHTLAIHSEDEDVIRAFALKKPVMRMLVNAGSALAGVGATSGLAPALTLGCGSVGGSATSDNVTPMNLLNIRRVAWGLAEIEALRDAQPVPLPDNSARAAGMDNPQMETTDIDRQQLEQIASQVIARLLEQAGKQ